MRVHYQCRDGRWLLLSIAADEWRWEKFKTCFNVPELDDERFATNAGRDKHAHELVAILDRLFAEHDLAYWRKTLDEAGLIFGVVGRVGDIRHDEQVLAAGFLAESGNDAAAKIEELAPARAALDRRAVPDHAARAAITRREQAPIRLQVIEPGIAVDDARVRPGCADMGE